jgi:hypothetical protein
MSDREDKHPGTQIYNRALRPTALDRNFHPDANSWLYLAVGRSDIVIM